MSKSLWSNKVWLVFLVLIAILFPSNISLPAQTDKRSVAIALGLDKTQDNQVELSVKIVVPHYDTTYSQNSQVITAKGENPVEALSHLSVHIGKIIGLSHCSAIIIGKSFENDNICSLLDEYLRGRRVNYNAIVVFSNSSAKDVLKKGSEISQTFTQNIYDIVKYNENSMIAKIVLLSDFYSTYYNGYGASLIPVINVSSNESLGLSTSTQNQSGGQNGMSSNTSQSTNSQNSNEYLSNDGETAIVKNGKIIGSLSSDEYFGFGILTKESNRGVITLNNITDKRLINADVVLSIKDKQISKRIEYSKTGIPRLHYKITCDVKLEHILQDNISKELTNDVKDFISSQVKNAFSNKIKTMCASAINKSKQLNFDSLEIYQTFNRFSHHSWQNYLKNLENIDDYLQKIEFFMEVSINNID